MQQVTDHWYGKAGLLDLTLPPACGQAGLNTAQRLRHGKNGVTPDSPVLKAVSPGIMNVSFADLSA